MRAHASSQHDDGFPEEMAWAMLLECASVRRGNRPARGLRPAADGTVCESDREDPESLLTWQAGRGWQARGRWDARARWLLDLYLPICNTAAEPPFALGHLGQSLDGYIATRGGDSCYVNDPQNLVHLHRLRALCDAVLVGAGTVATDDPRLTTRHVAGENPVRVVIDPSAGLPPSCRLFSDRQAPTLLVRRGPVEPGIVHGDAEVMGLPDDEHGRLAPLAVCAELARRGLRLVLVEGGGVTVSRFLVAGALDRLHIAVAPFLMGEGIVGVRLPPRERLDDCPRPAARIVRMGSDVLFDLDLRAVPRPAVDDRG